TSQTPGPATGLPVAKIAWRVVRVVIAPGCRLGAIHGTPDRRVQKRRDRDDDAVSPAAPARLPRCRGAARARRLRRRRRPPARRRAVAAAAGRARPGRARHASARGLLPALPRPPAHASRLRVLRGEYALSRQRCGCVARTAAPRCRRCHGLARRTRLPPARAARQLRWWLAVRVLSRPGGAARVGAA